MGLVWQLPHTSPSPAGRACCCVQGGEAVPGIQVDGMDVLAVRQAVRWAREWASSGKGPLFLEMKTYRYHGHSMSDPGISYRDREEVANVRSTRDCIDQLKGHIIEAGFATAEDIKALEKSIRGEVQAEVRRGEARERLQGRAMHCLPVCLCACSLTSRGRARPCPRTPSTTTSTPRAGRPSCAGRPLRSRRASEAADRGSSSRVGGCRPS